MLITANRNIEMISNSSTKSELINILKERGFIHQSTDLDELNSALLKGKITAYSGFDATANSLHVGHLLPIMMLRWIQNTGNQTIVLIGGGTTKVGDPSGKDKTREILDDESINNNIKSIKGTFKNFLEFDSGDNKATIINNSSWLENLSYIDFLRDFGQHFSVNRMLTMESVKQRIEREQPLTFLEFNYMILQAYDFIELYKKYNCNLQIGGSDQWGNIVSGINLGRKVLGAELHGITCPLLTTSSGQKMGKTTNGAIWLNSNKLAPYDYYQYWRNTEDLDVGKFLLLFTEIPLSEISKLRSLQNEEINEAKKILAFETTKILHGEKAAKNAQETAISTYDKRGGGEDLPKIFISHKTLQEGFSIVQALTSPLVYRNNDINNNKLCKSNGEARRLISQGGARINNKKIIDENFILSSKDFKKNKAKISFGNKKHAMIVLN